MNMGCGSSKQAHAMHQQNMFVRQAALQAANQQAKQDQRKLEEKKMERSADVFISRQTQHADATHTEPGLHDHTKWNRSVQRDTLPPVSVGSTGDGKQVSLEERETGVSQQTVPVPRERSAVAQARWQKIKSGKLSDLSVRNQVAPSGDNQRNQSVRESDVEDFEKTGLNVNDAAALYLKYPELQDTLHEFSNCVTILKSKVDVSCFSEVKVALESRVLEPFKSTWKKEVRQLMAYHMAKIGFAKSVVAYYKYVMYVEQLEHFTGLEGDDLSIELLFLLREVSWRLMSGSKKLAYKFGQAGFITLIVKDLKQLLPWLQDEEMRDAILSTFGVLYQSAKSDSNKVFFRQQKASEVIMPFFHAENPGIRTAAILTLAYIMEEIDNVKLMADDSVITYIVTVLNDAVATKVHRAEGYSCIELIQGLTALALNDDMKRVIMDKGLLPLLTQLIESGDSVEKEAATKALWTLAFQRDNREKICKEPKLISLLEELKQSSSGEEKMAAQGALFVLQENENVNVAKERIAQRELKRRRSEIRKKKRKRRLLKKLPSEDGQEEKEKEMEDALAEAVQEEEDEPKQHIMISYNWADQKTMLKVRDELQAAGYRVWMDVDQMGGSTLQTMAEAVENSAVMLMCMSEKYKLSPNCRTEAEYAYQLRKDIIPVLLQEGYQADGWLGIMLGAKLYFDFSGKYSFKKKIKALIKEIGDRGKEGATSTEPIIEITEQPVTNAPPPERQKSVSEWGADDMKKWLKENELENLPKLQGLRGDQLVFLQKLSQKAPEFFFTYLHQDLDLHDLSHLIKFTSALEKVR